MPTNSSIKVIRFKKIFVDIENINIHKLHVSTVLEFHQKTKSIDSNPGFK